MERRHKPYNYIRDYWDYFNFSMPADDKLLEDQWFHSVLEKIIRNDSKINKPERPASPELSSSSSSHSFSDDEVYSAPQGRHICRVFNCRDPECFSCEASIQCYNCSHCGINKSLQLPCLQCGTVEIHPIAIHKEIRCPYHTKFPKKVIPQFTVSIDPTPTKVVSGKFIPLHIYTSATKTNPLIDDQDKLAEYIACRNRNEPVKAGDTLLSSVLNQTYSQCRIDTRLEPQLKLDVDTSKYEKEPVEIPALLAMPPIGPRTSQRSKEPNETNIARTVAPTINKEPIKPHDQKSPISENQNTPDVDVPCTCYKTDPKSCPYPRDHQISAQPCVLCEKDHSIPCKCSTLEKLLESQKRSANEAINTVVTYHNRGCLDLQCPFRSNAMNDDAILKWFNTFLKLERVHFCCPLNTDDFPLEDISTLKTKISCPYLQNLINGSNVKEDSVPTFISNFLPRPLVPGQNDVRKMKFWDRLNCYEEKFSDHTLATNIPLIESICKPIFDDDDPEIAGRYDEVFKFWDRNMIYTPQKILVKKPETLVKLIETDDLPLKFEALYALYKAARLSKTLQKGCGQIEVIKPLLDVLDNYSHDGVRRLAIYILSMALRHPPGRCVIFELGPETVKTMYNHYLTDKLYAMRRAYMMVLSNLAEDTGACAMLSNAVSFENTFANMCEKDPDLQIYLMKFIYHAMHDIEGREKIVALPEFRLTPILSGCLSKKSRVREIALDLLDAIVSFCKQDIVVKTFKDTKGIKILNSILRKTYMSYAHPVVLKLYEKLASDPSALPMKEGSLANLVEFVDTVDNPKLIADTLKVLVKMARDPITKEILALTNVITKVAPLLVHTNEELAQSVLMIIELMADKSSRNLITQQLVKADPMVDLLWVVGSENRGWDTRVIALRCIIALLNLSPFFGECYIRCKNATNVINLLCHQAKFLTTYSKTLLVQVLSVLAKTKRNYEFLIRNNAIKGLLYSFKCFDSFESQLYAHSVGLLAYMMKDRRAVVQFSNVKNSWNLLAKKFMEKKFISADILMNLMFLVLDLTDNFEIGAKAFLNNGFLRWMIELEEIYPEMSGSIGNAIDSIIINYLPLKFAHHGFLNYQDSTNRSLFFVTKDVYNVYKVKEPFPTFDIGISNKLKPEKPIYYFNLPHSMRSSSSENVGNQLQVETSDNFELYSTVSRSADSVHKVAASPEDEEVFVDLEVDPKLEEMFEQVKSTIDQLNADSPPENHRQRRIHELMGIAKVVVKSMLGFDPTVPVTRRMHEIYMDSLKKHLGTNIFPLGKLVMGHKFERAILYKVLADALNIPCWLQRLEDKIAWNDVYVPPEGGYQGGELTPNFIIDLMASDPQLLPIKSKEAKTYKTNVDD